MIGYRNFFLTTEAVGEALQTFVGIAGLLYRCHFNAVICRIVLKHRYLIEGELRGSWYI